MNVKSISTKPSLVSYKDKLNFLIMDAPRQANLDSYIKETRLQGGLGGPITNATVDANNVATKGTFQLGAGPNGLINRIESIFQDDTITSFGWRTNWKFAPEWSRSID